MERRISYAVQPRSKGGEESAKKKVVLKMLLLGDSSVGKTSLLTQFVKNQYSTKYRATIGVDFLTRTIVLNDTQVELQIWDTAGQEKFHSLVSTFYRGTDCCALIFDLQSRQSLDALVEWRKQLLEILEPPDPSAFPVVVIGNRLDLIQNENGDMVNSIVNKAEQMCKENGYLFFKASAKDAINVEKAFVSLVELALPYKERLTGPAQMYVQQQRNKRCCGF